MRRPTLTGLLAACLAAATLAGTTAGPELVFEDGRDAQRDCTITDTFVTQSVAADHLIGDDLRLGVHVVLDRDVPGGARKLLEEADELTYAGLNVDLSFSWGSASVPGDGEIDTEDAFDIARRATGGRAPAGSDVVYLLTDNDLVGTTASTAGQANCIGGIRDPREAYAVGEFDADDLDNEPVTLGIFRNITGKIFAHEVGHLLGAHHHYANCAEGAYTEPTTDVLSVCTLMINDVGLASFNFSSPNAAVARGHVADHAG